MAKAQKYFINFYTQQGQLCTVRFLFEGWTGDSQELLPSDRPFVLSEFNNDENLFKPIRPQLATIEFIGSSVLGGMDAFLANSDTDVEVRFNFGSFTDYWIGYLLQENFQEIWQDTNHVVRLTASEGIGLLEYEQFNNNGVEVVGRTTFYNAIKYCMQPTPIGFTGTRIVNNLFHHSMTDTGTNIPLDQCYLDARSFQVEARTFDTKKIALEKINEAFGQTIFQYYGQWFIYRPDEAYTPLASNIRMVQEGSPRVQTDTRFDVNVGVSQEIKPVSSEMIRFINRRTKRDINRFKYELFNEVVENESFTRGNVVSRNQVSVLKVLDSWIYQTGTFQTPTTPTGTYGIVEQYNSGILRTSYAYFSIPSTTGAFWIKSTDFDVYNGQKLDIQFEVQYDPFLNNFPTGKKTTYPCWVYLNGVINNYQLLNTGKWVQVATSYPYVAPSGDQSAIALEYDSDKEPIAGEWNTISLVTDNIPDQGSITIYFYAQGQVGMIGNEFRIKNFVCKVLNGWDVDTDRRNIIGQKIYYQKTTDLRRNTEYEIYFGDNFSSCHKGTIYQSDAVTIADRNWYRKRFPTESHGFRKQSLIARWENNRFNRNKIDATFFGLTYSSGTKPIGLMNTIKFVNDDPNKIYSILNLREIDFAASIWSATLLETYDSGKDYTTPATNNFSASVINGTYTTLTYVPYSITSAADVIISPTYVFAYAGDDTITVNIAWSVAGSITGTTSFPTTVSFYLQKNGTTIATVNVTVDSNPEIFNATTTTSGVVLSYNDTFAVAVSSNLTNVQLTGGTISFSYVDAVPFLYDPYIEEYISN